MNDLSERYASDPRSSEQLVEAHRLERGVDDADWEAMHILRYRGGRTEFEIGRCLAESENPEERAIGADLLAQLGWGDHAFQDESVDILIRLLADSDSEVIYSAAIGLGHRGDPRAIEPLIGLADNEDPQVRYGVAFGLLTHEDERAISTLIRLSGDLDHDTRNWAMFGLGSQIETDTPAIREALAAGLDDANAEIRGEALVGLARRGDSRVKEAVLQELGRDNVGILALEAAEILADLSFVPRLIELFRRLKSDDSEYFKNQLLQALVACKSVESGKRGSNLFRE